MTTESDGEPRIVLCYSLSDAEVRTYWRASAARQQNAGGGRELSWIAYLGAFPVGLVGGFIGIAFGMDPLRFGGLVAALVGLGYISGHYALHIVTRRFKKRLATAYMQNFRKIEQGSTVEITRDGLSQASSSHRTSYSWSMVRPLTRHEQVLIM